MVLTVTIHPLLERRYIYRQISYAKGNRNGKSGLTAGGKGLNVSRQLKKLDVDNIAFTFLGGANGKLFKEILQKEGINFTSIKTINETRDAALIIDELHKTISTFFSCSTVITEKESEEFKLKLEKMIQNSEIVIFSGSSPCSVSDSIFPFGIEAANKYGKVSICDTYGNQLKDCIKARPTILHNNIMETENSLGLSLKAESEILNYLDYLYDNGIKQSYITNGSKKTYSSNFGFKYKVENPIVDTVDSTGSGDSFTAGIAYGFHYNLTYEKTLIIASSLGAANAAKFETCNVKPGEIETLKPQIKISTIGKKIRLLNVEQN